MNSGESRPYWRQLPPEEGLLLLCARTRMPTAVPDGIYDLTLRVDWPRFLNLAFTHGVAALVYPNLKQQFATVIPAEILMELKQYVLANTHSNLVLLRELFDVARLLDENGIEFAVFKGLMVMQMVYRDLSLRRCGDIDLLVRKEDFARTRALFLSRGFQRTLTDEIEVQAMQSGLRHEEKEVEIDLHWGIPPKILNINSRKVLDGKSQILINGKKIPAFSPEDMFIVLCVNASKEYWRQFLYPYCDIREFIESDIKLDWDLIVARANELRCLRMLKATLAVVAELFDVSLPPAIRLRSTLEVAIHKVKLELLEQLFAVNNSDNDMLNSTEIRHLYHFRSDKDFLGVLIDDPLKRFAYNLVKFFIPNQADKSVIVLPEALGFLYYIIRPVRIITTRLIGLVTNNRPAG